MFDGIEFISLAKLNWLWAVLFALILIIIAFKQRHRALARFASRRLERPLTAFTSLGRRRWKAGLLIASMVFLVAALIDPRWGTRYQEVEQRGIDLYVLLDISKSMLAEDVKPNRLDRAKHYISDLLESTHGDRVGLITFAGVSQIKTPLTIDYRAIRTALEDVRPQSVTQGGSKLGDAIRLAADSFTDDIQDFKAILVLSDGEDMDSFPVEAAASAFQNQGVRVFTVGLGDQAQGSRIPISMGGNTIYLTYQGEEVWSRMDPNMLTQVAMAADGRFYDVGVSNVDLGEVYKNSLAPTAGRVYQSERLERAIPRYQWFVGIGLLLLFIQSFLGERRSKPSKHAELMA